MIVLATSLVTAASQAQPVTRVKAKLVNFDGRVMTLQTGATDKPLTVALTPETRFVQSQAADFGALAVGGYAGAAVSTQPDGGLRAQDVYVYADALRGTGEGRFPDRDRLMVNGTVSKVEPSRDGHDGVVTIHYRGALVSQAGKGKTVCEGRASPAAYASPLSCAADAAIQVLPGTAISALTVGDVGLLVPGATVTVAMVKLADGSAIAPGVIVDKPAAPTAPPVPVSVAKPAQKP